MPVQHVLQGNEEGAREGDAVDRPAARGREARRAGAELVRWIEGVVADLDPVEVGAVDLTVMTGNVAQVFVTDGDWTSTIRSCGDMLRPGGHLVFETRDPAQRAWEGWSGDGLRSVDEVDGVGTVESWIDVTSVDLPLVTFDSWFRFVDSGETVRSTSTLRFRELSEIEETLGGAGFEVVEVRDAPDRPGREFVVIARRVG